MNLDLSNSSLKNGDRQVYLLDIANYVVEF